MKLMGIIFRILYYVPETIRDTKPVNFWSFVGFVFGRLGCSYITVVSPFPVPIAHCTMHNNITCHMIHVPRT